MALLVFLSTFMTAPAIHNVHTGVHQQKLNQVRKYALNKSIKQRFFFVIGHQLKICPLVYLGFFPQKSHYGTLTRNMIKILFYLLLFIFLK